LEPILSHVFWGDLIKYGNQVIESSMQEFLQHIWMFYCIKDNLPQNMLNLVEKGWLSSTESLPDLQNTS
jgi:hypothetical protein